MIKPFMAIYPIRNRNPKINFVNSEQIVKYIGHIDKFFSRLMPSVTRWRINFHHTVKIVNNDNTKENYKN